MLDPTVHVEQVFLINLGNGCSRRSVYAASLSAQLSELAFLSIQKQAKARKGYLTPHGLYR